jgi:hypothetical protein
MEKSMTKLDRVMARLRALPSDELDQLLAEIEFLMDAPSAKAMLTDEEWAELKRQLDQEEAEFIAQEQVLAAMRTG